LAYVLSDQQLLIACGHDLLRKLIVSSVLEPSAVSHDQVKFGLSVAHFQACDFHLLLLLRVGLHLFALWPCVAVCVGSQVRRRDLPVEADGGAVAVSDPQRAVNVLAGAR